MKRIAFLGPVGTVSEESARCFFSDGTNEFVPYALMADVFEATAEGRVDYGVVPIENTIEGSVKHHIDLLVDESNLPILAEWTYPSVQNLIGRRAPSSNGSPLSEVRKVVSKDVAIAQCQQFLRRSLPHVEFEYVSSTAEGVRIVRDSGDPGMAAIGTRLSAELYGLELLEERIADHNNNYTRFVLIGKKPFAEFSASENHKTTILVTLPEDYPGALHQVLSAFAWRRINLSKIESRPTKKNLGSYYFYIDIEMSLDTVLLPSALQEIEAIGCQVRVLGSYPSYTFEMLNRKE